MKKIVSYFLYLIIFLICLVIGIKKEESINYIEAYNVYLNGEIIGRLKSKEDFEDFINKKQSSIKKEYNVKKIYNPNSVNIQKVFTYNNSFSTPQDVYNTINTKASFYIKGYEIKINAFKNSKVYKTENSLIYVLDKNIFKRALKKATFTYINEKEYENYIKNIKPNLVRKTGKYLDEVKILNDIAITEKNISTKHKIFRDEDELAKYLLFGSEKSQIDYKIKEGENVEDVAFKNKMGIKEFLIANPTITEDQLLYPGQVVNVAQMNPLFNFYVKKVESSIAPLKHDTKFIKDNKMYKGKKEIIKKGKDGKIRLLNKIEYENGEVLKIDPISDEILENSSEEVVKIGTKSYSPGFSFQIHLDPEIVGMFYWPVRKSCTTITSGFGYRSLRVDRNNFHDAVDISCPEGSPIYAMYDGVVMKSHYSPYGGGNEVMIKHEPISGFPNGFVSVYSHMVRRKVVTGEKVQGGQLIGLVGHTGAAFGNHLHFGVSPYPWKHMSTSSTTAINPLRLYRK